MKKILLSILIIAIPISLLFITQELMKTFQYSFNSNNSYIILRSYTGQKNFHNFIGNNKEKNEITIPNHILSKPVEFLRGTFHNYQALESVWLPNTINVIDTDTFNGCRRLTQISLPDNLTYIGDFAFAQCESLKTLTLPSEIWYIGQYAFSGCTS